MQLNKYLNSNLDLIFAPYFLDKLYRAIKLTLELGRVTTTLGLDLLEIANYTTSKTPSASEMSTEENPIKRLAPAKSASPLLSLPTKPIPRALELRETAASELKRTHLPLGLLHRLFTPTLWMAQFFA